MEEETSHCGVMKGPKDAKHAEDRGGGMEQQLPTTYRVTVCDTLPESLYGQTVLRSTITFAKMKPYPLNCRWKELLPHRPPPVSALCSQSLEEFKAAPVTFQGLLL